MRIIVRPWYIGVAMLGRMRFALSIAFLTACSSTPLTARPEYSQEFEQGAPAVDRGPTQAELAGCGSVAAGSNEEVYGFVVDGACRYTVRKPKECGPVRCVLRFAALNGSDTWSGPCSAVKAGDFIFDVVSRDGRRGVFMMSYTRPDAALDIGDGKQWISGRIGLLKP